MVTASKDMDVILTLYKTKRGNFFLYNTTLWQREQNNIEVITEDVAKETYEALRTKSDRIPKSIWN